MKYYMLALKNYAVFRGRSNRSEYWFYVLFNLIFAIAAMALDTLMNSSFDDSPYGFIYLIYVLVTFIPGLAVAVRRLHDTDKSGWFFLIALIPLIGGIWLLVVLATKGTDGDNQYGPDPNGNGVLFDFERAEN
jgi:uncharacterized membrane protein YhaH (DUF805 family)